jgi:PAS domain S-box-containing protein
MARTLLGLGRQNGMLRSFRKPESMLEQMRRLFLVLCLAWPTLGVPGLLADPHAPSPLAAILTTAALAAWWCRGYLRQGFPLWDWPVSGAGVLLVLWASGFELGIGMLFVWLNFRALYGSARHKMFGAAAVAALLTAGLSVTDTPVNAMVSVLFNACMTMAVMHILAGAARGRDRASERERSVVAAGGALAAATTRAQATEATLAGGMSLGTEVAAATLVTRTGEPGRWRVVGTTESPMSASGGPAFALDDLPDGVAGALTAGGSAMLTGADAARLARVLGLMPRPGALMAPLSVRGHVFGLLALTLDRLPADDMSGALITLADQTALAYDQLRMGERFRVAVENSPDALFLTDIAGTIRMANPAATQLVGTPAADLAGRALSTLIHPDDLAAAFPPGTGGPVPGAHTCRIRHAGGDWTAVEMAVEQVQEHDGSLSLVVNARDVSERHRLEMELRHAQKLESVGRLAAGIAHEINTPIQFVGDNVRFLQQAFTDVLALREVYEAALTAAEEDRDSVAAGVARVREEQAALDLEFILEEIPQALDQTLDGISRVANIVRAMKAFGHPSGEEMAPADLNQAIGNTLIVANNEIKYVADVRTDFGELPPVSCHLSDINQVVLNLVVNAAHAVAAVAGERGRGEIRVATRLEDDPGTEGGFPHAVIEVTDSGIGIPAGIAEKVFEPFFTTKEVGTGTGQGLSLVRSLVVDRHRGSVDFSSEPGVGTTFTVRLPVAGAAASAPMVELTGSAA